MDDIDPTAAGMPTEMHMPGVDCAPPADREQGWWCPVCGHYLPVRVATRAGHAVTVTDRARLLELFDGWGIGYQQVDDHLAGNTGGTQVILEALEGGVDGYGGFAAIFRFGQGGEFLDVGIWE